MSLDNPETLVSVIIPCHNRSMILGECLESVAKQTYQFIEVIVVDDASTEDLKSVISCIHWPDTYVIQYIRLDENRGQGYAREVGRQNATGAYINYQDSDDLFHPDKIRLQVEMLRKHPGAGMCYCITLDFYNHPFDGNERLRGGHYIEAILPYILEKRPWATGSCLWTRAASNAIGPWLDGRHGEDFEYDIRAGCIDLPVVYIPKILMYVRRHSGEAELRAPSKQLYQQLIISYKVILDDLQKSEKIKEARCHLGITREVVRICCKLLDAGETASAIDILQRLVAAGAPTSKTQGVYFWIAKIILFSRFFVPRKYQPRLFAKAFGKIRSF